MKSRVHGGEGVKKGGGCKRSEGDEESMGEGGPRFEKQALV